MRKIMLILEDYNELVFVETVLKKLGFDALGLQSESQIHDKILGFSPHLIISEGVGRKINGLTVSHKTKRVRGLPKFVLVLNPQDHIEASDLERLQIDYTFFRPLHPPVLIDGIAKVLGLDADGLQQKLKKLGLFQEPAKERFQIVGNREGAPGFETNVRNTTISPEERDLRFRKSLSELPEPEVNGLDRRKVQEQTKEFRIRENDPEIHAIDDERQAFVRALFKK